MLNKEISFDNFRDEDKTTSGTVEGYVFYGAVMNEFVDIQEYYPSKDYFINSPVCPDNQNQYWYQEDLNEKTIRHWPKYTTLNWFETPDRTKKSRMGIYLKVTASNNKETIKSFGVTEICQYQWYVFRCPIVST